MSPSETCAVVFFIAMGVGIGIGLVITVLVATDAKPSPTPLVKPVRSAGREAVYALIDGERDYQDEKWCDEDNSVGDWLTYIRYYLRHAEEALTIEGGPDGDWIAMDTIRKITAMGVAAMEDNETPARATTLLTLTPPAR